jgi:cardiolipin synthase A/B
MSQHKLKSPAQPQSFAWLRLLQNGQDFFPALIAAIDQAQQSVWLETYIFHFAGSCEAVAQSLEAAALRGLEVRVLVDGVGTPAIPLEWHQRFANAGVQWRVHAPVAWWGLLRPRLWQRLHRKLCLIDGWGAEPIGFCGGINLLDDFYHPSHGGLDAPRFDFAVQINARATLEPMVRSMNQFWRRHRFIQSASAARVGQWGKAWVQRKKNQIEKLELGRAATDWARQQWRKTGHQSPMRPPVTPAVSGKGAAAVSKLHLIFRDNFRNRTRIEQAYLSAIEGAKQEIIIANAYFLPGARLRHALRDAALRGVQVRLLLQGRYEYFVQYYGAAAVYGALLKSGVDIYQYEASFLHAKVAVVDSDTPNAWATVGSSNLDPLSLLLAREANVVVEDTAFARDLRERLVTEINHYGQRLDPEHYAKRSLWVRVKTWAAYAIMRLGIWLAGQEY